MPYSHLMAGLVRANILVNRKMLASLAIHEPYSFRALADIARAHYNDGLLAATRPPRPSSHILHRGSAHAQMPA